MKNPSKARPGGVFRLRSRPLEHSETRRRSVLYYQCRFRRGSERTVAWIEARGAQVGAFVELETLDKDGPWEVEAVFDVSLEDYALKDMQRLNRKSLSSILKNVV
jgi:hypothetical protein